MKLSMHMLEHWLREESAVSVIIEGKREIFGARLFEEADEPISDYLYVGRTENFFPNSQSHKVMLMHHNDMISVECEDLNYVFNRVLAAFEYYETLQQKIFASCYEENAEQSIVSLVEHLVGPTFIMRPDYRILACSQ